QGPPGPPPPPPRPAVAEHPCSGATVMLAPVRLYNTLTRRVEEVVPVDDRKIGMYSCGPTVYRYVHIGNLRTFLLSDLLRRALGADGTQVRQVQNITEVGHMGDERFD